MRSHLLEGITRLLTASAVAFAVAVSFELVRGSYGDAQSLVHVPTRKLVLTYLAAILQSIGSFLLCLWLALFQSLPFCDLMLVASGNVATADISPARIKVNRSVTAACRLRPFSVNRGLLLIPATIFGVAQLCGRVVFVQHGEKAQYGGVLSLVTACVLVLGRLIEMVATSLLRACDVSRDRPRAHLIEVLTLFPHGILLTTQVALEVLNCIFMAAADAPLARNCRALQLTSCLVLSIVCNISSQTLLRAYEKYSIGEWPPSYSIDDSTRLDEEPQGAVWLYTGSAGGAVPAATPTSVATFQDSSTYVTKSPTTSASRCSMDSVSTVSVSLREIMQFAVQSDIELHRGMQSSDQVYSIRASGPSTACSLDVEAFPVPRQWLTYRGTEAPSLRHLKWKVGWSRV